MEEELEFGCRFLGVSQERRWRRRRRQTDLGYVQIEIQLILSGGVRQSILLLPYGGASSTGPHRGFRVSPRLCRGSVRRWERGGGGRKKTGQLSGRPPNCSLITVPVARSNERATSRCCPAIITLDDSVHIVCRFRFEESAILY